MTMMKKKRERRKKEEGKRKKKKRRGPKMLAGTIRPLAFLLDWFAIRPLPTMQD